MKRGVKGMKSCISGVGFCSKHSEDGNALARESKCCENSAPTTLDRSQIIS